MKRVEEIWNAKPGSAEGDELELTVFLLENYESKHYKISSPDPVEAIKFRMEQMGMEQKDLAELIGASRASEILNRKRNLSIEMIRVFKEKLGMSADSLIGGIS